MLRYDLNNNGASENIMWQGQKLTRAWSTNAPNTKCMLKFLTFDIFQNILFYVYLM